MSVCVCVCVCVLGSKEKIISCMIMVQTFQKHNPEKFNKWYFVMQNKIIFIISLNWYHKEIKNTE